MNYDNIYHTKKAVSQAPSVKNFGCFPRATGWISCGKPRQVFLSASGLWLAVLFTLVIFLVAAMLARYVTSKGEKEQIENVESAPTTKEAPSQHFPNKRNQKEKERFFLLRVGLFFCAGKTQPLTPRVLLYTKFMEPKGGANLEIRRVLRCDIIEAGGSALWYTLIMVTYH